LTLFLDTSVLVAAFLGDHPGHAASIGIFERCKPGHAFCAGHSLAETYSTLTRIPEPYRATADEGIRFLDTICGRLTVVSLEPTEYRETLREASVAGIVGGT
jgi:predicted nucleic acid-binding protein